MSYQIIKNKMLVGAMYAPFCRTKYVDPSEWDNDLRIMRELGYTCLHGFTEWWRIEKKKGEFDFSETDLLIELCHKHGIVPIINVATQNGVGYYMPRWMQNEYKGRGVVDNEGQGNEVKSEYVIPCMDDPWYQVYAQRYLRALATHYAGDDRIGGWVIWGEPTLYSKRGKPICYCEHTVARFRKWLAKKYGNIEALNAVWGAEGPHDHADFEEIYPPVGSYGQRGGYASWTDWQTFMCENFADHIKQADRIFKECGATQPTITEMFSYIHGGGSNDVWLLAETADIVGVSNYTRPGLDTDIVMTVANSAAKRLGKSVFIVEALGGPRYPTADKRSPSPQELITETVQQMGSNAKGLMYWCFRPRLSDYEGGAYGMSRADGKLLPRTYAMGKIADETAKQQELLLAGQQKNEVAILYSTKTQHLAGGDLLGDTYYKAVMGATRLLLDAHITPQMVSEDMLVKGLPKEIKALVLPFAYAMDDDTAAAISEFVKNGGCVIADHDLSYKRTNGFAHRLAPGGLTEAFGLERDDLFFAEHPSLLPEDNRYEIPLKTMRDVLCPVGAEVVEEANDMPLITKHAYGAGKAWYLAWEAFGSYHVNNGIASLRKRVKEILAEQGVLPFVTLGAREDLAQPGITTCLQVLPDGGRLITLVNASYEAADVEALVPQAADAQPVLGSGEFTQEKQGQDLKIHLNFKPWESIIFQIK